MTLKLGMALTAGLAMISVGSAAQAEDVFGRWYTPNGDSIIEIHDCGDGTPCGTVVWYDETTAQFTHDIHNKNEDLRTRPILGMVLLEGFERATVGWDRGIIYNPEDGKTYKSKLKALEDGTLEVKGCVAMFCKGQIWPAAGDENVRMADANGSSEEDNRLE